MLLTCFELHIIDYLPPKVDDKSPRAKEKSAFPARFPFHPPSLAAI
jgi:hypothetical protein